ncbi:MAG: [FeFe] hydrogenase H-cluster radical SAM maturase HydG [Planctomycetes bacterium]|jgi:2-iminoacetate synthase|nr:[FeFe] hydrogenase H-cluster radical SAM maturase HydG [Planctomycetota bacterium]HNZ66165.1 [FeFe] hydrogenase H-cluster radical SAM maturase HydG [Planctomycetota bacterium]HPY75122.1 [FeFe] hydrogenase H-cluster radical SAM maturase HydG [Planctomycetota bacterium]HQB00690.1 [FeFe] hydrogenase H-cluster radical SAM maturase HydG [Planctomycetota bacterium]
MSTVFNINDDRIQKALDQAKNLSDNQVRDIFQKAKELKGLNDNDIASLMMIENQDLLNELYHTAFEIKEIIYGKRLVIFAPLYISNYCKNECLYCAFRASNKDLHRKALNQEEISEEVKLLLQQGHKRILIVAGESYPPHEGLQYILDAIATTYATKIPNAEVRRVNVNLAPMTVDEFKQLKNAKIGTFQLFQETYHVPTYEKMHVAGKKRDYQWRITAFDRAMEAGIDDVGIGVLFGLADWKYEILAMMQQIQHLEQKFGVGPHTISVPRLEPAHGSDIASNPPYPVSDQDFKKIVAILRLAVPYTGMILSTRENAELRKDILALGISQISAGSRTNPGGYKDSEQFDYAQFQLGDHRGIDEVIQDITKDGYIPSFCTGCYRLGRTGADFMDLAKPGEIKKHCQPNAISTFLEYLIDFASPKTKEIGMQLIQDTLKTMDPKIRQTTERMIEKIQQGKRDVYV